MSLSSHIVRTITHQSEFKMYRVFNLFMSRCNAKYQYTAIIDSKNTVSSNKETTSVHTARGKAYETCSEWLKSTGGRYEIFGHLDDIGSRSNRNWFLLNDCTVSNFQIKFYLSKLLKN